MAATNRVGTSSAVDPVRSGAAAKEVSAGLALNDVIAGSAAAARAVQPHGRIGAGAGDQVSARLSPWAKSSPRVAWEYVAPGSPEESIIGAAAMHTIRSTLKSSEPGRYRHAGLRDGRPGFWRCVSG